MKSPMADANVAIINELKTFMERAVTDNSEREKYTMAQTKDFTRRRILTFPVLTLMILNAMKRSLSIETEDFFSHSLQGESCTKQAFSKQRGKQTACIKNPELQISDTRQEMNIAASILRREGIWSKILDYKKHSKIL
jgi:hypothetical protein